MKMMRRLSSVLLVFLMLPVSHAQEKPTNQNSSAQSNATETPFRIQVVVNEYDGSRKVSSLPYTLSATSRMSGAKLRTGVRVPVSTGTKAGESAIQYVDIGTNIDCTVRPSAEGKYSLDFIVERSSVNIPGTGNNEREWSPGDPLPNQDPVLQQFRVDFGVLLRDGQTEEGTVVSDPLTGHVIKVEVTLAVLR